MARTTLRLVALLLISCTLGSSARAQDAFRPIFNGTDLAGWIVDGARVDVQPGVVTVHEGPGWLRLNKVLANFVLRMDVHLVDPSAKAGIFVRSWPTFDETSAIPNNGYRIVANVNSADVEAAGRVVAHGRRAQEARFDRAAVGAVVGHSDTWHRYDIECVGNTVTVTLDGKLVSEVSDVQNPQGFIALRADAGAVEFRNIELRQVRPPQPPAREGVVTRGRDVVLPRMLREVKPRYTPEAMRRKIQGAVWVSAVVQPDGNVADATVTQSLDPEFGLDAAALDAAKQWRFVPGTREGQPVPVLVTIELWFVLR